MKIIDKYIVKSILKTAVAAIMIFAMLLAAVELFMKMDFCNNLFLFNAICK